MILVVCALREELRYVPERADIAILACGVGPVEAAIAVARELERTRYRYVLSVGIGGAYEDVARVGEGRLIASECLAELGLEGGAPLALPGGARTIERARADSAALERCRGIAPFASGLTVTTVTTTAATGERLRKRYGTEVESMEGFAVLRAAEVAGIPALEIRGISNYVGERSASRWNFDAGARAAASTLDATLSRLSPVES